MELIQSYTGQQQLLGLEPLTDHAVGWEVASLYYLREGIKLVYQHYTITLQEYTAGLIPHFVKEFVEFNRLLW